jgi:hypothetical protein
MSLPKFSEGGICYIFQCWNMRSSRIYGFGGMGDRFDLVSPPTANKVIAKTFLEDSHNIINNHEKPYKQ